VAADPLRSQDHRLNRLASEPDSGRVPGAEFFQTEADEIESLDATISEAQSELAEAVETATEVATYEPEEDEKVTAAVIKKALKELIDDLGGSFGESATR